VLQIKARRRVAQRTPGSRLNNGLSRSCLRSCPARRCEDAWQIQWLSIGGQGSSEDHSW